MHSRRGVLPLCVVALFTAGCPVIPEGHCLIAGVDLLAGAADPQNECATCDPTVSQTSWTARADGVACAGDANACTDDLCRAGVCVHPELAVGTPCGAGQVCGASAACAPGCFIGGAVRAPDEHDVSQPCRLCAPGTSTTEWTSLSTGASCGTGKVCSATGACTDGCFIDGAFHAAGAYESESSPTCWFCDPAVSTSAWTAAAVGSVCGVWQGTDLICDSAAACRLACFLDGAYHAVGATRPGSPCHICDPVVGGPFTWVGMVGTSCGLESVCTAESACARGCYINGAFRAPGALRPNAPCYECDPSRSTVQWSLRSAGASCATGRICDAEGVCLDACRSACGSHCGPGGEPERSRVHAFYYPWYETPAFDGAWRHWEGGGYDPALGQISSAFFPALGPYSAVDPVVLQQHLDWVQQAGIGVLVYSWWGPGSNEDDRVRTVMDAADARGLKVAFYVEPYGGGYRDTIRPVGEGGNPDGTRTPQTAAADVRYLVDQYGCHNAFYRVGGRPVFYFFAAREYQAGDQTEWAQVWSALHADAAYDPIVIAHDSDLPNRIVAGGWDGGHEYGCAWGQELAWGTLLDEYAAAGKLFSISLCPGYDDTRVNPGGGGPETSRDHGGYYDRQWSFAVNNRKPWAVSIATFNEWHEGTQIEPAQPKATGTYDYLDYEGAWGLTGAAAQRAYLDRSRHWADKLVYGPEYSCMQATLDRVDPSTSGSCTGSAWSGAGPGLLECHQDPMGGADVLVGVYRQASTGAAALLARDVRGQGQIYAYCGGYNYLELRIRVTNLASYQTGWIELGNCMDCAQELQWEVPASMLLDDQWTTVRFQLRTSPNFANVDWNVAGHLRFYWFGKGTGANPDLEDHRVLIDSVRIAW